MRVRLHSVSRFAARMFVTGTTVSVDDATLPTSQTDLPPHLFRASSFPIPRPSQVSLTNKSSHNSQVTHNDAEVPVGSVVGLANGDHFAIGGRVFRFDYSASPTS